MCTLHFNQIMDTCLYKLALFCSDISELIIIKVKLILFFSLALNRDNVMQVWRCSSAFAPVAVHGCHPSLMIRPPCMLFQTLQAQSYFQSVLHAHSACLNQLIQKHSWLGFSLVSCKGTEATLPSWLHSSGQRKIRFLKERTDLQRHLKMKEVLQRVWLCKCIKS